MASVTRVSDTEYDGSCVTLTIGTVEIKTMKCEYGDSLEPEWLTQQGSQEQDSQTDGSYKTDNFKVTISASEYHGKYLKAAQKYGFGNKRVAIVVGYRHPDLGSQSDSLERCKQVKCSVSSESGGKPIAYECEFTVKQVKWGNDRKTINRVGKQQPLSSLASKF